MEQQNQSAANQTPQQPVTPETSAVQTAPTASPVTPPQLSTPINSQPVSPASPPDNHKKRKLMLVTGIFVIALFLIGSVFYIMGVMNRTKRLREYKIMPSISIQPTNALQPTIEAVSAEEMEAASVDTGDPEKDLMELDVELNSLGN